ncbi:MAG: carboxypeptidase regulatory-like domain-containing protein [Acidobacteriota bacterium]
MSGRGILEGAVCSLMGENRQRWARRWVRLAGQGVWAAGVVCSLLVPNRLAAQSAPWVTGDVAITGTSLTVFPSQQTVPLNVPTVVQTTYGGAQIPEGAVVEGDLSGPAFQTQQPLSAKPNEPFQIPPISVAGSYLLSDIRLVQGGVTLGAAVPSQVAIDVRNVLISSVTSRAMTWDEIQQSGILLNTNDYKAVRYTVGLGLKSGTVNLDFPVLFSASDPTRPPVVLNRLGVSGPPPLPNVISGTGSGGNADLADLGDLDLEPVQLSYNDGGSDFDELDIPELNLSGLLIFPNRITFLNQFFVVALLLQNGSPSGSSLTLNSVTSTITFPDGSQFVLKGTNPPALGNGAVPVMDPGPDGVLGTGDDRPVIVASMQGQSEFDVTTPKAGTYTVTINFTGTLNGLPSSQPITVHGKAYGVVVVRDPVFHVTFAHPAVVRQGDEYVVKVTVTNTSDGTTANDVTLALPSGNIEGAALVSGQPGNVSLGNLGPGQSATAQFTLLALRTGQVTVTSGSGTGGTTGTVVLTVGVGDAGIPLSPDTLILPPVVDEQLPADVVHAALDFLGLGWSLATAPPDQRPANMAPVSEGHIRYRANELTAEARYLKIAQGSGWTVRQAVAELCLEWLGNDLQDGAWDALRRLPADQLGPSKGQQLVAVLGSHLIVSGQNVLQAHEQFTRTGLLQAPHFSVAMDPSSASAAPNLWLEDGQHRRLGNPSATLVRDLPWGESLPLGGGTLLAVGHIDGSEHFTLHLEGTGDGRVDLSVAAPLPQGPSLVTFIGIPVGQSSQAKLVYDASLSSLVLENDLDGTGTFVEIPPTEILVLTLPRLAPVGAIQDLMADEAGRAVSVLFNRRVDTVSAGESSHYALSTRAVAGAYVQPDGRVVEVRAQSRISPLVTTNLVVTGVAAQDGSAMDPPSVTLPVKPFLTAPGGTVHGTVFGEDGAPLAGATVYLWEWDHDLLRQYGGGLEGPDPTHVTQELQTDASGQFYLDYVMATDHSFTIEAVDSATGDVARLSATFSVSQPQDLVVSLFMRSRGNVKGTISGADGMPAAGVLVTATELSTHEFKQVFSDQFGRYEIDKLPVGTISVLAQAPGGPYAQGTTSIHQPGDVAVLNLQLVSTQGGAVQGVVKDADGNVLPGAVAALMQGNQKPVTSVLTAGDGSFLLQGVPPGVYSLEILEPVTWIARRTLTVTIESGQTLDLHDILLPAPAGGQGTVTGRFLMADHVTPVAAGATVYIASQGSVIARATTDESGAFALSPVPVGSWTVTGYDPVSRRSASGSVTTYDGQTVGTVLYLPGYGVVYGTVYGFDSSGQRVKVSGAAVLLQGLQATTGSGGQYTFGQVGLGSDMKLVASLGVPPTDVGYGRVSVVSEGQSVQADIQLLGRGDLTVHTLVRGTGGNPDTDVAAQVTVISYEIDPTDLSLIRTVATDYSDATTGLITFHHLLGTSVSISATNGFNGSGGTSAQIRSGLATEATVYLEPTGSVQGTIFAPDGVTPVPHALVTLSTRGMPDRTLAADTDGHYGFDLVPMGYVQMTVQDSASGRRGFATGLLSDAAVPLRLDLTLLGSGEVAGTALEDDGSGALVPAANAVVTLKGSPPLLTMTTTTDVLGQFLFSKVEEGGYSVQAVDSSHAFTLAARASVQVVKDQTAQLTLTLGSFGTVQGQLVGADLTTPVPSAQVTLSLSNSTQVGFAVTDVNGEFSFAFVPVGVPFSLDVFDQRTGRSAHGSGTVSAANAVVDVPLHLNGIGTIQGTVWHYGGSDPVGNPLIQTVIPGQGSITATGDTQGVYLLSGLPEGSYTIRAVDPANGASGTGGTTLQGDAQTVTLDLTLPPFGAVEGDVVRADGVTPAAGAIVTLDSSHQTLADTQGHFHFGGVALATYWVSAADPLSRNGGKVQVALTENGQTAEAPVRFVGLGKVTGVVRDGSGNPVLGFQVVLHDANGYTGMDTLGPVGTDANGYYAFQDVRSGSLSVTVSGPPGSGDARRGSAAGTLSGDGASAELDVTLSAAGTVRGVLVDQEQKPVLGATVTLTKTATGETFFAGTDASGTFLFPVISIGSDGHFTLFVAGPWGGHVRGAGEITSDGQVVDVGTLVLDTAAPAVSSTVPTDSATGVPLDQVLSAVFQKPLDGSSVNGSTISLKENGGAPATCAVELSADGLTVTVTPSAALKPQTSYTFTVGPGIRDLSGNPMAEAKTVHFTSLDTIPPAVSTVYPADGATQVAQDAVPFVLSSEPIDSNSLGQGLFTVSIGGMPVSGTVSQPEPNKLLFMPASPFATDSVCSINISGYQDLAGNPMTPFSSAFATVDTLPPTVAVSLSASSVLPAGVVTVSAIASDNLGLDRVEFYANSALIGTATASSFEVSYTAPSQPGQVQITATAFDKAGNQASDTKALTVNADTNAPVVTVTSPQAGAEFMNGSAIAMQATATDDVGVVSVEFRLEDTAGGLIWNQVVASPPYQASYPVSGLSANLDRNVVVKASDLAGNVGQGGPVLVHLVYNHDPVITTVSPTSTTPAIAGSTLHMEATASDQDGTVGAVDFFINDAGVKTMTAAPYVYDYPISQPVGTSLVFQARVTGDKGEIVQSPAVSLTVVSGAGTTAVHGAVVNAQGVGVSGATVSADGYDPTASSGADGTFDLAGVPVTGGTLTLRATFVQGTVSYLATKDVVPIAGGTTQAGSLILYNPNDTSAIKGNLPLDGNAIRVARWDANYAVVATTSTTVTQNHIYVIDVSNPAAPANKAQWTDTSVISDMKVCGNYVFVGDSGLTILQIGHNGSLTQVSQVAAGAFPGGAPISSYPNAVAVSQHYAYVANYSNVWTLDVSNPSNPSFVSVYGPADCGRASLVDLKIWRNELLGITSFYDDGGSNQSLVVGVIGSTGEPTWTDVVDVGAAAQDGGRTLMRMFVDGNTLYVSRGPSGVVAFDLAENVQPAYKGVILSGGNAAGMFAAGEQLYVAAGMTPGVQWIQNLTTGTAAISAQVDTPGEATDIAMTANALVVADGSAGVTAVWFDNAAPLIDVSRIGMTLEWVLPDDFITCTSSGVATNPPWSYGWKQTEYGTFTPYNSGNGISWFDSNHHSGDNTPGIWKNTGSSTSYGVPPGSVSLHPGWDGSWCVARWTSPVSGRVAISGSFGAGDRGAMSYGIYVDGTRLFYKYSDPSAESFSFVQDVSPGTIVEFAVGTGSGGYAYGNTPLFVSISPANTSAGAIAPEVVGLAGAVKSTLPPISAFLKDFNTGTEIDSVPVCTGGSVIGNICASPGDEITLTVTDSAGKSTTVSLGKVPAESAGSFVGLRETMSSNAVQLAYSEDWLLVNDTDRVMLIDVLDPASPVVKATWVATQGTIWDMSVSGNFVEIRDNDNTYLQIGVDGSGNPTLTKVWSWTAGNGGTYRQAVTNGQAEYHSRDAYVYSVDVSTPSAPKDYHYVNAAGYNITDMGIWRNWLLLSTTAADRPVIIASLANPWSPVFDTNLWPDGLGDGYGADHLYLAGDKLYVSRGSHGMAILDLLGSPRPVWLSTLALPSVCEGVTTTGAVAYLATEYGYGMHVLDVNDPSQPSLVVTYPVSGAPHDVVVRSGYAYLATGGGVRTVSLAGIQAPLIDQSRIIVQHNVGDTSAQISGLSGAVWSATPPCDVVVTNSRTSETTSPTTYGDGSFSAVILGASSGDALTVTVTDAAIPPHSTTTSLGRLP